MNQTKKARPITPEDVQGCVWWEPWHDCGRFEWGIPYGEDLVTVFKSYEDPQKRWGVKSEYDNTEWGLVQKLGYFYDLKDAQKAAEAWFYANVEVHEHIEDCREGK